MIAKIIKGTNFSGVVSYMLSKREGKVKVLQANGVRSSFPNDIAHDFNLQASMRPSVQKPVCHTILSFSAHDSERLTDATMVKIANEYLHEMGYGDTQNLIVRHSDRNIRTCTFVSIALVTMVKPSATTTKSIVQRRFVEN